MPTIVLQSRDPVKPNSERRVDTSTTASVGTSPGRIYNVTTRGVTRHYERVGVDSNGQDIYRDQNRRAR